MKEAGIPTSTAATRQTSVPGSGRSQVMTSPASSTMAICSARLVSQPEGRIELPVTSMWRMLAWISTPAMAPWGVG